MNSRCAGEKGRVGRKPTTLFIVFSVRQRRSPAAKKTARGEACPAILAIALPQPMEHNMRELKDDDLLQISGGKMHLQGFFYQSIGGPDSGRGGDESGGGIGGPDSGRGGDESGGGIGSPGR
jgi:hypothetical protein